jgi:hypothetical protein
MWQRSHREDDRRTMEANKLENNVAQFQAQASSTPISVDKLRAELEEGETRARQAYEQEMQACLDSWEAWKRWLESTGNNYLILGKVQPTNASHISV